MLTSTKLPLMYSAPVTPVGLSRVRDKLSIRSTGKKGGKKEGEDTIAGHNAHNGSLVPRPCNSYVVYLGIKLMVISSYMYQSSLASRLSLPRFKITAVENLGRKA